MSIVIVDIFVWIILATSIIIMLLFVLLLSDKSKKYKIFTLMLCIPFIFLEIPHFMYSDNQLYDAIVHLFAGLSIYLVISNFKFFPRKNREWISLISIIIVIIGVELFLSILVIFTTFINPNTINILWDIMWTTIGGIFGFAIYYSIKNTNQFALVIK